MNSIQQCKNLNSALYGVLYKSKTSENSAQYITQKHLGKYENENSRANFIDITRLVKKVLHEPQVAIEDRAALAFRFQQLVAKREKKCKPWYRRIFTVVICTLYGVPKDLREIKAIYDGIFKYVNLSDLQTESTANFCRTPESTELILKRAIEISSIRSNFDSFPKSTALTEKYENIRQINTFSERLKSSLLIFLDISSACWQDTPEDKKQLFLENTHLLIDSFNDSSPITCLHQIQLSSENKKMTLHNIHRLQNFFVTYPHLKKESVKLVLQKTLLYLHQNKNEAVPNFFTILTNSKEADLEDLITKSTLLSKKILPQEEPSAIEIFSHLLLQNSTDRTVIYECAFSLLPDNSYSKEKISTTLEILKDSSIREYVPYVQEIGGTISIVEAFNEARPKPEKIETFIQQFIFLKKSLCNYYISSAHIDLFCLALFSIAESKRDTCLTLGIPFFEIFLQASPTPESLAVKTAIELYNMVDEQEWVALLNQTVVLSKKVKKGGIDLILKELYDATNKEKITTLEKRITEREDLIKNVQMLISSSDTYHMGCQIASLISILKSLAPEERSTIIRQTILLTRSRQATPVLKSLQKVVEIEERLQIFEITNFVAKQIGLYDITSIANLINSFHSIPTIDRIAALRKAYGFLDYLVEDHHDLLSVLHSQEESVASLVANMLGFEKDAYILKNIWQIIVFIEPSCRGDFLKRLVLLVNLYSYFNGDIVDTNQRYKLTLSFIFADPIICDKSQAHFLQILRSTNVSAEQKLNLCRLLMDHTWELRLDNNQPLIDEIITQIILCDPSQITEFNHPFRVYDQLKQNLSDERDRIIKAKIAVEEIAGEKVHWVLQKPSERRLTYFTVADIPTDVSSNTLLELFDKLKNRIESLPPEQCAAAHKEIEDSCSLNLEYWKRNLLEDELIKKLLSLPPLGQKDAKISLAQLYLFRSLQAIQDQFSLFDSNSIFSKGEDKLLKFSVSMQNCSIGRYAVLVNFYLLLPPIYKVTAAAADTNEALCCAKEAIETSIQHTFQNTFSNTKFLCEVTGLAEVTQASHVTLYLSNRLGQQINLMHQLQYDPHTQILNQSLLKKDGPTLLTLFFKYCSLKSAIQQLIEDSRTMILDTTICPGIMKLLHGNSASLPGPLTDYFDYAEDENGFDSPEKLTPKGALLLLKALNYAS